MDKKYLIKITNNLYRLTLLFPKKEPLKYKMRGLSNEILANLIFLSQHSEGIRQSEKSKIIDVSDKTLEDFEILDGFFEIARSQNWISPVELLEIQQAYNTIKEEYKLPFAPFSPVSSKPQRIVKANLGKNPRHQKILSFLREQKSAQVGDLQEIFPEVSKRTIRRDFESLFKKGIIERMGERNQTFYRLS